MNDFKTVKNEFTIFAVASITFLTITPIFLTLLLNVITSSSVQLTQAEVMSCYVNTDKELNAPILITNCINKLIESK